MDLNKTFTLTNLIEGGLSLSQSVFCMPEEFFRLRTVGAMYRPTQYHRVAQTSHFTDQETFSVNYYPAWWPDVR